MFIRCIIGLTLTLALAVGATAAALTTTWIGNSNLSADGHIINDINGFYVDGAGKCFAVCGWDEGGHNVQVFQHGKKLAGCRESGTGSWNRMSGKAITADANYLYQAMKQGGDTTMQAVQRYKHDGNFAPWTGGAGNFKNYLVVSNAPDKMVVGLAIANKELFVADSASGQIKVYNAETMSATAVRSWPVSDPGPLAIDAQGMVWMLQPTAKKLLRYSTTGALQPQQIACAAGVLPTGFCVDGKTDRILLANGGVDNNILIYKTISTTPTANGTFGVTGGIFDGTGATLGAIGPLRFNKPTGVGVDDAGNIYVACDGCISGGGAVVEEYTSAGVRQWALYGINFVDCYQADPGSETDIFSKEEHFVMDYSKPAGQDWSYVGYTCNRLKYPNDPRLHNPAESCWTRRINGQRFLFITDMGGGPLQIYRFNAKTDGECAIPCGMIAGGHLGWEKNTWPPAEPAKAGWIWRDTNGNGNFEANEYLSDPKGWGNGPGWCVDSKGDIWGAGDGIRHLKCLGLDANGSPMYDFADGHVETWGKPAPFNDLRRLVYDADKDTLYLSGYTPDLKYGNNFAEWKCAGRLLASYPKWSTGNRTAAWQVQLPDGATLEKQCLSWDVAGDYLFTVLGKGGQVYVFETATGAYKEAIPVPKEAGHVGWADLTYSLMVSRRTNGEYLIFMEEDGNGKVILHRWNPAG